MKQNLALMLGAGGKLAEAEKLAHGTPAGNAAYLKILAERANGVRAHEVGRGAPRELLPPYGLGASSQQ